MVNHNRRWILIGGAALPVAGLLAACGNPPAAKVAVNEVLAPRAPPPMPNEPIPPIPMGYGDMATWMPGYWRWTGAEYLWVPGSYVDRPRLEANWVPARWEQRGMSWVYVQGYWS